MIITIAGLPGSGKTTVAKIIAAKLGYKHYSIGDFRGKIAERRGISLNELNEIGLKEDWPHREADEFLEELGKTHDDMVIDAWLGFHFIPQSIKIFISVDSRFSAERVFKDLANRPDEDYASVEETENGMLNRIKISDEAYKKLYNISFLDQSHYDLTLDSTDLSAEEVANKILDFVKNK